jgi:hypothetical protein
LRLQGQVFGLVGAELESRIGSLLGPDLSLDPRELLPSEPRLTEIQAGVVLAAGSREGAGYLGRQGKGRYRSSTFNLYRAGGLKQAPGRAA